MFDRITRLSAVACICGVVLLAATGARADDTTDGGADWTPIFDGESLAGWEGNLDMFRVRDGAIVGGSLDAPIPHNEFLCTEREYGDFELRLEAKMVGENPNAGIQFRSRRAAEGPAVSGYQCDMGFHGGHYIWGWIYDEGRRRRFVAPDDPEDYQALGERVEQVLAPEDWNRFRIRCEGPRIQIWLNDMQTVDYTETDDDIPRQGILGLQIHGGPPSQAWYRKLEIREL